MERRLTAILAADVVGYSRLMTIDETGTLAALTSLRKIWSTLKSASTTDASSNSPAMEC
jgi:adenylate cyclase